MRRARRWSVSLLLCAAGIASGGWTAFQWVRDAAAASRSDTSFYGAVNARWDGRFVADATARQFPGVIATAHTVRLPFRGEPGHRVELHIVQSDSNRAAPPALQLSLNGADASTLTTQPGSGRDPIATERASPREYDVELAGETMCGDNVVQLTAVSGTWIAIERIDA